MSKVNLIYFLTAVFQVINFLLLLNMCCSQFASKNVALKVDKYAMAIINTPSQFHKCSGILIHSKWVLITARCTNYFSSKIQLAIYYKGQIAHVEGNVVTVNPKYDEYDSRVRNESCEPFLAISDIALIRLKQVVLDGVVTYPTFTDKMPIDLGKCEMINTQGTMSIKNISMYSCNQLENIFKVINDLHSVCKKSAMSIQLVPRGKRIPIGSSLFCNDKFVGMFSRHCSDEGTMEILWVLPFSSLSWIKRTLREFGDSIHKPAPRLFVKRGHKKIVKLTSGGAVFRKNVFSLFSCVYFINSYVDFLYLFIHNIL